MNSRMSEVTTKPKRKRGRSPTSRTLEYLNTGGYVAEKVEQRLPGCFITRDLFNVIDVVAISPADDDGFRYTLGVQVTSGSNHASRREKALHEPLLRIWLEAGNLFDIHSWSKRGARGTKRKLWTLRTERITLASLSPEAQQSGEAGR